MNRRSRTPRAPYILFHDLEPTSQEFLSWQSSRELLTSAQVEADGAVGSLSSRGRRIRSHRSRYGVDESGEERVVIWRLLSANHREIATSGFSFTSIRAARQNALRTTTGADAFQEVHVVDPVERRYGWFLRFGGTAALFSRRWYQSPRDRNRSIEAARSALQVALETGSLALEAPIDLPVIRSRDYALSDDARLDELIVETGIRTPIKELGHRPRSRRAG